jgi:hypothetical protein
MGDGMSFPKKGNFFPAESRSGGSGNHRIGARKFAEQIAGALNDALGGTSAHIKIVAAWTGANERTVKNWFSGHYGPSGDHLVTLIKHSDDVLSAVLSMADRRQLLVGSKMDVIEERLIDLTGLLRAQRGRRRSGRPRPGNVTPK